MKTSVAITLRAMSRSLHQSHIGIESDRLGDTQLVTPSVTTTYSMRRRSIIHDDLISPAAYLLA